jgi:hypothetical protein
MLMVSGRGQANVEPSLRLEMYLEHLSGDSEFSGMSRKGIKATTVNGNAKSKFTVSEE